MTEWEFLGYAGIGVLIGIPIALVCCWLIEKWFSR